MVCLRLIFLLSVTYMFSLCGCISHYQMIKPDRVELYLKKKGVKEIKIAYSLDQFTPHATQKISRSLWLASVPTTREFSYFYLVNGAVYLPQCTYKEKDDFGSENCIYQPDE